MEPSERGGRKWDPIVVRYESLEHTRLIHTVSTTKGGREAGEALTDQSDQVVDLA